MRIKLTTTGALTFLCPGCGHRHVIPTSGKPAWSWNGSHDKPTIMPSVNEAGGHHVRGWKQGDGCWCGSDVGYYCYRCHFNVTDGRIIFHNDSSHALKGQTVDLPEIV